MNLLFLKRVLAPLTCALLLGIGCGLSPNIDPPSVSEEFAGDGDAAFDGGSGMGDGVTGGNDNSGSATGGASSGCEASEGGAGGASYGGESASGNNAVFVDCITVR